MKTERIGIRTTEEVKIKLLTKSQEYNTSLSDFILDVVERECDIDIVQVWINAYINYASKYSRYDRECIIKHYKTVEGDDCWSMSIFEDTYFSRVDMLKAIRYNLDVNLHNFWAVLDQWDEFVRRLKLLGMWEEEV